MLIQSSLPNSIREPLSFVPDHGKQEISDPLSDWPLYCGIEHNSPKCDECCWDGCRKSTSTRMEKDNAAITGFVVHSMAPSNLSANGDMCACCVHGRSGYVYKRRRKNENYFTIFSEQGAMGSTKGDGSLLSSMSSERLSLTEQKRDHLDSRFGGETEEVRGSVMPVAACKTDLCPQNSVFLSTQISDPMSSNITSKSDFINRFSVGEHNVFNKLSSDTLQKLALENYTSVNDSCSSSKSNVEHGLVFAKTEVDDTAECSSSDIVVSELLWKSSQEKELCVSTRYCASIDIVDTNEDRGCSQSCKICGFLDKPLNMLICDLCEEAFHLSCCNPRVKKIPVDEWYCRYCTKKKPKPFLETTVPGNSLDIVSEASECGKGALRSEYYGPMKMLRDTEPYTTGVRIGKAFQADVPNWSGPISDEFDKFGEPVELGPAESISLNEWSSNPSSTHNSIGNWLQCREVIYESTDDDVGVVCRKWRRAPLFEVQTDDWDCSCALVWDPIHADCAVPQELETNEVMMHLKYIELLRPRLAAKSKLTRTKNGCSD